MHFPWSVVQNHTVHVFWSIVVPGTIFVDFWVSFEPKSDQNSLENVLGVRFGPRRLPWGPFRALEGSLGDPVGPRRLPWGPFRSPTGTQKGYEGVPASQPLLQGYPGGISGGGPPPTTSI